MASHRAIVKHQLLGIRTVIQKVFGYRTKWLAGLLHTGRSFGLEGLDTKLLEAIDTSPSYYIEIGANDGVAQSNTLALELFYGWKGLLIEPSDAIFGRLKKNRSKRRNYLLQSACVTNAFPGSTVELIYANLMSVALGLDNDALDPYAHAKSGAKFLSSDDAIRTETVPATTMTRALEIAGAPGRIGLLSLDVEGAELEVLQGIDFEKYRFDWMLIECRNIRRLASFLEIHGYALQEKLSVHDYLFSQQRH